MQRNCRHRPAINTSSVLVRHVGPGAASSQSPAPDPPSCYFDFVPREIKAKIWGNLSFQQAFVCELSLAGQIAEADPPPRQDEEVPSDPEDRWDFPEEEPKDCECDLCDLWSEESEEPCGSEYCSLKPQAPRPTTTATWCGPNPRASIDRDRRRARHQRRQERRVRELNYT